MSVQFSCELAQKRKPFAHCWEHTVGSGHALLALRSDWQSQLERCHKELGIRHVRFHGLLSDDVGTFMIEQDKPLYSFFNSDRMFDFILSIGMRPFVELSFMPSALSSGPETVFHYRGNVTPPKDYRGWARLIKKLVQHWVDRYGLKEVSQWFFEVWNEPNLKAFWTGDQLDYFKLYSATARAIKQVDSGLRVGGPVTAQNAWIEEFMEYCRKSDSPTDFITTHYYPTDALGTQDTDTISQLADAPHGVMRQRARETFEHARGLPVYYTEWSISSNPRDHFHDEPFAAALAANIAMSVTELVQGFSYWTFSDIFEENYFPSHPFHGGFGMLNLYGIPKPVYRSFELLHHLGAYALPVAGNHKTVSAWATTEARKAMVLMTNHAMPRHSIRTEKVHLTIRQAARPSTAYIERIDEEHANALTRWRQMGSPEYLSGEQVEQLDRASSLERKAYPIKFENGVVSLDLTLPPHSVALVTMEGISSSKNARRNGH